MCITAKASRHQPAAPRPPFHHWRRSSIPESRNLQYRRCISTSQHHLRSEWQPKMECTSVLQLFIRNIYIHWLWDKNLGLLLAIVRYQAGAETGNKCLAWHWLALREPNWNSESILKYSSIVVLKFFSLLI